MGPGEVEGEVAEAESVRLGLSPGREGLEPSG